VSRVVAIVLAACGSAAPPPPEPPSARVPRDCIDVAADIAKRVPDAKPEKPYEPVDLDGDGTPDAMFGSSLIGGNRDVYLYASGHGCARYLGQVLASFTDTPSCAEPAVRGVCRISTMRYMIHGDQYEYFYACDHGACTELGVGRHVDAPEKFRP
jgi:hypothetical protein